MIQTLEDEEYFGKNYIFITKAQLIECYKLYKSYYCALITTDLAWCDVDEVCLTIKIYCAKLFCLFVTLIFNYFV